MDMLAVTPAPKPAPAQAAQQAAPGQADTDGADFAGALEQQMTPKPAADAQAKGEKTADETPEDAQAATLPTEAADIMAAADGLIALMTPAPVVPAVPQTTAHAQSPAAPAAAIDEGRQRPDAAVGDRPREPRTAHARPAALELDTRSTPAEHAKRAERDLAAPAPQRHDAAHATTWSAALPSAPAMPTFALATPAPAAQPHIAARVGTAEWNDSVAQHVTLMVKDGEQTAQLRLDPPELGPLEVRLSMGAGDDGVAHAQFVSPHAAVRDALEAAIPQLRAALADSGITLGNASVGDGFLRDDARQPQHAFGTQGSAAHDRGDDTATVARPASTVARRGLVDTFA